jgi:endonuclease/exonuclease/phosphatase (EEP) superfamily protein YafD
MLKYSKPRLPPAGITPKATSSAAAIVLTAGVAAATACAAFAGQYWLGDLAVHFPAQYAVAALLGFIALSWTRRPAWAAVALFTAGLNAMNAAAVFGETPPPTETRSASGTVAVRMVSINVLYRNRDYRAVVDFLLTERPDVAVLEEITPQWRRALAVLDALYPYKYASQGPAERGVLLISRWPIRHAATLPLGREDEPAVAALLDVHGKVVQILGVHTSWPLGPWRSSLRDRQLVELAGLARARLAPLIVLGDLNITPFSPHFQQLLRAGALRSAAQGFGWQPTWPQFLPPAGIQIDHGLVSPDIAVRGFRRGPRVGSDHWPVVLDLVL